MIVVPQKTLYEIERHINNYFNPQNNPDSPEREYPDSFLELARRIHDFRIQPHLFVEFAGLKSTEVDHMTPWTKVFAQELSIYKRMKSI